MAALLAALALLLAAPSPAAAALSDPHDAAVASTRAYHEVLLRCPSRIWPGLDWGDLQFLFSDSSSREAWLVGKGYKTPARIEKDETLADIFEPGFSLGFLDFRGLRTAAVSTEARDSDSAFRAAVNGHFRLGAQADWEDSALDDRGALYPLLAEPRYLRRMAADSLLAALDARHAGRDARAHLAAAAWWLARWKKNYPEELAMRTDTPDGTALYAEQMARLLFEAGCGARGEAFEEAFRLFVRPELSLSGQEGMPEEGAALGSISSFLLSELRPGWQREMNGRLVTSELVVKGIAPLAQPEDHSLRALYEAETGALQVRAARHLEPELALEADPSSVRVSVPNSWMKSQLNLEESFVLRARRRYAYFFLERSHEFGGDYGVAKLPGHAVLHQGPNPCGGNGLYFLVPATSVTAEPPRGLSRVFRGTHGRTSFRLRGVSKNLHGFTWLCPWL